MQHPKQALVPAFGWVYLVVAIADAWGANQTAEELAHCLSLSRKPNFPGKINMSSFFIAFHLKCKNTTERDEETMTSFHPMLLYQNGSDD